MTLTNSFPQGWRAFKRGLSDMFFGACFILRNVLAHLRHVALRSMHDHPLVWMAVEAAVFITVYVYGVGRARVDRDIYQHSSYINSVSRDSLQLIVNHLSRR